MLNRYFFTAGRLERRDSFETKPAIPGELVWFDLTNPTPEEDQLVGSAVGVSIPTRDEMEEIEISSRLYQEDGAEFMTVTASVGLETDEPRKVPVTFILKGSTLVTVRYADPKPFAAFIARSCRPGSLPCHSGELVMIGLLEAIIDRIADVLEKIGNDIDLISADVFRNGQNNVSKKTRNLQSMITRIGWQGDLISMMRESLVTITRVTGYHTTLEGLGRLSKETRSRIRILQRDASSLSEHAMFMSSKVNFLLDATLGLINLEQNQIIKIFSVAAVVFLPPTLVASIYGMNFDTMPEIHWLLGYPWALLLMIISAALPYLFFKRKGWL